jgi:diacylglycerol kinase
MTSPHDNPIQRIIKKFAYAFEGLFDGMLHDFSIQLQFGFATFALLVAWIMRFTVMETAILLICIGLVLCFEYLNSALESMIDHLEPKFSKEAKVAKDLGAASVGLSALISLIVGLLFIINHL